MLPSSICDDKKKRAIVGDPKYKWKCGEHFAMNKKSLCLNMYFFFCNRVKFPRMKKMMYTCGLNNRKTPAVLCVFFVEASEEYLLIDCRETVELDFDGRRSLLRLPH